MQNSIISHTRTTSGSEPVTLAEVKTHLHITDSENDTELTAMITRARKRLEDYANISIVTNSVVLIADLHRLLRLPFPPVVSIQSISFTDDTFNSEVESLAVGDYSLIGSNDAVFKSSRCGNHTINYTTGMTTVPDNVKLAILEEILYRYENKGDEDRGICDAALVLIQPYVQIWL